MLRKRAARGFSLIETIIASILAVIVIISIGQFEGGRIRLGEEVLQRSGLVSGHGMAGLATQQMAKGIARADRFVVTGTGVQLRYPAGCMGVAVPAPSCFDNPANYQWDQYRMDGANQLVLYANTGAGCGSSTVLARDVTVLTFTYKNQAGTPPGGEPMGGVDNNTLEYVVTWDDGTRSHDFRGQVISRAIPYSDVNAGGTNSGSGLAPAGVAGPPGVC